MVPFREYNQLATSFLLLACLSVLARLLCKISRHADYENNFFCTTNTPFRIQMAGPTMKDTPRL